MAGAIQFTLDGRKVEALAGETIWQVAARQGMEITHLCHAHAPGYLRAQHAVASSPCHERSV